MNKLCVVGSMNMDMVMNVKKLPKVGETFFVREVKKIPGGKGANQAVAASRLGCSVYMISSIGNDSNGTILKKALEDDKIDTTKIFINPEVETGMAIITVDENADNTIAVVSGANMTLDEKYIRECKDIIDESKVVITQFETPIEVAVEAFKMAKENNSITVLNPAPAKEVKEELYKYTDIVIPNETEAFELTGIEVTDLESAKKAGTILVNKGVKYAIITLGSKGAAIISKDFAELVPAFKVDAVDSTAAGDSFIGGLSRMLMHIEELNEENLKKAVVFGNKVSSITVTREGAQSSIPTLEEVIKLYGEI